LIKNKEQMYFSFAGGVTYYSEVMQIDFILEGISKIPGLPKRIAGNGFIAFVMHEMYNWGEKRYDVPLEFTNAICKILSVNQAISDSVEKLRSQLLLIIQTNSLCAISYNQSGLNIVLENIFCERCNQVVDIDLNKLPLRHKTQASGITCLNCNNPFPKSFVEEILVGRVSKLHLSIILQDWKCTFCKKIGARFLANVCDCNNSFENSVPVENFLQNLESFLCISKLYSLENLQYYVEQILSYC